MAGLGVQVLFGFLLSLPSTNRFTRLSPAQHDLYLACLVLAAVATALLLGPVAYHRLVFRRGLKESLASPLSSWLLRSARRRKRRTSSGTSGRSPMRPCPIWAPMSFSPSC